MSEGEQRVRAFVRNHAGDYNMFVGYLRGLLGDDGATPMLAVWALDEQDIMRKENAW